MEEVKRSGWAKPTRARRWHYVEQDSTTALCGKPMVDTYKIRRYSAIPHPYDSGVSRKPCLRCLEKRNGRIAYDQ